MIHIYDSVGIKEMSGPVKKWAAIATSDGIPIEWSSGLILADATNYGSYRPVIADPIVYRTQVPRIVEVDDNETESESSPDIEDPTDPNTFTTYKALTADDGKAILTSDGSYILMGITISLSGLEEAEVDAPKDRTNGEWKLLAGSNGNIITTEDGNGILIFRNAKKTRVIWETIETVENPNDSTRGNYYRAGDVDYNRNGDVIVNPTECRLEAELNGTWKLTLICPIDDEGRYKHIVNGAVIGCPTWYSKKQLFRIYDSTKDDLEVTALAHPIFMDSGNEVFILDRRPTNCTGQQALDSLLSEQNIYHGKSDITKLSTSYVQRKNLIEAIESDDESSFLNRWGGEVFYDNYTIHINERVGSDRGMMISYALNATGMQAEIDTSNVVTRIVPTAYNGRMMSGKTPWVDSPHILKYPTVYTKTIQFDNVVMASDLQNDEGTDKIVVANQADLDKKLRELCMEQFDLGIDRPKANFKIDLVDISKNDEYDDLSTLLKLSLGDTVVCRNKQLDIDTKARVTRMIYDCSNEMIESVELGDASYDYFSEMKSAVQKIDDKVNRVVDGSGQVKASEISGIINGMKACLRVQQSAAVRQNCRAILFEDTDPTSATFGAMCMGTKGFEIADKKDQNGEWIWSTFGTAKGFVADLIVAGLLASKNFNPADPSKGGFGWNLDTGDLYANNGHFSGVFTNRNDSRKAGMQIKNGEVQLNSDGNNTYLPALVRAYITAPDGNGVSYVDLNSIIQAVSPNDNRKNPQIRFRINGRNALSGKVEFSNGTYMTFVDGLLVGGNTTQGGF